MISSLVRGNINILDFLISLLISIPAVLIAISVHEAAHAYVAYKLGDPTAKLMGRTTINPIAHFDWQGALFMLLFGFGWAKPVPFNLRLLKHPKRDVAFIAAAGPLANLIVGFVAYGILYGIIFVIMMQNPLMLDENRFLLILIQMIEVIATLNLSLMVFNLIPIPPLDGSKVVISLLPKGAHKFVLQYERFGLPILMIWILISDYLPWFLSLDTIRIYITSNVYEFIMGIWSYVFNLFV